MENVLFYNGTGAVIELALNKAAPGQVTKIQKDQITPQVIQAHGESIAIANMDNLAIHVGVNINSQYLIRQFGWEVAGVEPFRAHSRANKLQEKQAGFDASIVKNAVDAEKALDEAVTDTGTTRARVERLDKKTAQKGALNVVEAAAKADKAEGTGAEPPSMPEEDQGSTEPPAPPEEPQTPSEPAAPTEPETPQEPSQAADPTSETQGGGEASEGGGEAGPAATEGAPETPKKPKSKSKAKKAGKGKKSGGKKKSS
jgi:hypothetical protein